MVFSDHYEFSKGFMGDLVKFAPIYKCLFENYHYRACEIGKITMKAKP